MYIMLKLYKYRSMKLSGTGRKQMKGSIFIFLHPNQVYKSTHIYIYIYIYIYFIKLTILHLIIETIVRSDNSLRYPIAVLAKLQQP